MTRYCDGDFSNVYYDGDFSNVYCDGDLSNVFVFVMLETERPVRTITI